MLLKQLVGVVMLREGLLLANRLWGRDQTRQDMECGHHRQMASDVFHTSLDVEVAKEVRLRVQEALAEESQSRMPDIVRKYRGFLLGKTSENLL